MKIIIEIKEAVFSYDFEIGSEKGHGDHTLNVQGLRLFSAIIDECHKSWSYKTGQEIKEIECMAYLEKHPEVITKYIELEKKRNGKK